MLASNLCGDLAGKTIVASSDDFSGKWVIKQLGKIVAVATTFSLKHATPFVRGNQNPSIIGIVTKSLRFPNGFDCANLAVRDGKWVWSCRDGRNGEVWDGSDIVQFSNSRLIAGGCSLIDIYESSE